MDLTLSLGIWTINNVKNDENLYFYYADNRSPHIGEPISCLCQGTNKDGTSVCKNEL